MTRSFNIIQSLAILERNVNAIFPYYSIEHRAVPKVPVRGIIVKTEKIVEVLLLPLIILGGKYL